MLPGVMVWIWCAWWCGKEWFGAVSRVMSFVVASVRLKTLVRQEKQLLICFLRHERQLGTSKSSSLS